jgi:putative addiction module component (TIGR02574 family)
MSLAELPQLQKLTAQEKLQLIGELWHSIDEEQRRPELTEELKARLDERLAADDANPDAAMPVDEFMAFLDQPR